MRPPERSLRVVYVNHCAKLSGGELAMLRLVGAVDGVRAHVVLAEDGPLVPLLRAAGAVVDVEPVAAEAGGLRRESVVLSRLPLRVAGQWAAYTFWLARWLRRERPDVVHTNSLKAAVYGTVAARLAGVPVVCHIRDRIAVDYLPGPAAGAVRALVGLLADGVIANSVSTLNTLQFSSSGPPARVIRDGVPAMRTDHVPSARLRVGILGRISPWKGQDVFLRAFAEAFPEDEAEAVVIGAPMFGEVAFDRELRALAETLGLGARVEFTGFRADIAAELARLDVLVHASVIPEPFGLVVVEGMAAGLAVVAADAGGPAEVVVDGVTGLLVPPGDVAALARALTRLAESPDLRRRLGEAAARKATEFLPEVVAPLVSELYREVLAGPRRSVRSRLASARPRRASPPPRWTGPASAGND